MDSLKQNLHEKAEEIGIDVETLKETLVLYFEGIAEQIIQMKSYVKAQDYANLHIVAHTLKGTSLNLHFPEIAKVASEIEKYALDKHKDSSCIITAINKLTLLEGQAKMKICYS